MAYRYLRVCHECGDAKEVSYIPKQGTLCIPCRAKQQMQVWAKGNTKPAGTHKRYIYFCPHCPVVRVATVKKKTSLCGDCSRVHSKRKRVYIYFNMETMMYKVPKRFFRICKWCGDTKQVPQASVGGLKTCIKCRHLDKTPAQLKESSLKRRETMEKKAIVDGRTQSVNRPKPRSVSAEAIEAVRKQNAEHRANIAEQKKRAKKASSSTKTDAQMIAEFLKKKKKKVTKVGIVGNVELTNEVQIKGY